MFVSQARVKLKHDINPLFLPPVRRIPPDFHKRAFGPGWRGEVDTVSVNSHTNSRKSTWLSYDRHGCVWVAVGLVESDKVWCHPKIWKEKFERFIYSNIRWRIGTTGSTNFIWIFTLNRAGAWSDKPPCILEQARRYKLIFCIRTCAS